MTKIIIILFINRIYNILNIFYLNMADQAKLSKICSKYILQKIFEYIRGYKLKYSLFVYSKYFQNLLDLDIINYENRYISKFDMSLEDFLLSPNDSNPKSFNKNYLKDIFDEKIRENNLDEKLIRKIIVDNIIKMGNEMTVKEYYDATYIINIFSPLLFDISKTKIFQNVFTLEIQWDIIEKFNLENDYKEIFNKLNESNVNYSLISFKFKQYDDIKHLKELNIDLKKLKSLGITQKAISKKIQDDSDKEDDEEKDDSDKEDDEEKDNDDKEEKQDLALFSLSSQESLFKNLFSMNDLYNNLLYLKIDILEKKQEIKSACFNGLINFKSLKFLSLNYLQFSKDDYYTFNLENIEIIYLENCTNIAFGQKMCNNLKEFNLEYCGLIELKSPLNFPKLKEFEYKYCNIERSKMINFSSLNKLKYLKAYVSEFLLLGDNRLKEIQLKFDKSYSFIKEKEMFSKILSLKKLELAEFYIKELDNDEILNIPGENNSLKTLIIHWINVDKDCNLLNIQAKFPNITKLKIKPDFVENENEQPIKLEIKEDKNCKITCFSLCNKLEKNIKFNCAPFTDLVKVNIKNSDIISNLKDAFPLFKENSKDKFLSLKKFKFYNSNNIDVDILRNLYNNLDNLPLIRNIHIECLSKEMDEVLHKKFIEKLLSLKLDKLTFIIKKNDFDDDEELYENEELEKICPGINFDKYQELNINKLNN